MQTDSLGRMPTGPNADGLNADRSCSFWGGMQTLGMSMNQTKRVTLKVKGKNMTAEFKSSIMIIFIHQYNWLVDNK